MQICSHTCTRAHEWTPTHALTHTCTFTCIHTNTSTHMHTHTHRHPTGAHSHPLTHVLTLTLAHSHMCTFTHAYALHCMQTHLHTQGHTHMCTLTHTRVHTHIIVPPSLGQTSGQGRLNSDSCWQKLGETPSSPASRRDSVGPSLSRPVSS